MRRGFKTQAETFATAVRAQIGIKKEAPLPAIRLASHLKVQVFALQDIPGVRQDDLDQLLRHDSSSWSAFTLDVDGHALIFHNTAHAPTRTESNLMHELAHLLLEHTPTGLVPVPGFPFPLREYDAGQEEEADWLGGCLKVPREALLWAAHHRIAMWQMVSHFGASDDLIRYRWGITGINRQLKRALSKKSV